MKQKQQSKKSNHKKLWIISGSVLLGLFLIVQITFNVYVYLSLVRPGDQTTIITQLVLSAVEGLHKPAPVEPATGKVYLPEARLVLPAASNTTESLLYSSNQPEGETSEPELQLTTSTIMGSAESKLWAASQSSSGWNRDPTAPFSEVPNLQACSRGVRLFFAPQDFDDSKVQLQATKTLANGKTIYLYTDSNCSGNLVGLAEYVKQAQSY